MLFRATKDRAFMARCLELAKLGLGWVSPNPLVGAVIVKHGKVIGEGYHAEVGGAHAEVASLQSSRDSPRGATLFVNLEPCNHQGRTPPCTEAIIAAGIKRVVVGMRDPNPAVAGGGIERLREAGVHITIGVREPECQALNHIFSHWVTLRRPYVAAKVAMSSDYKIAVAPGVRTQLTGPQAQAKVHELRQQYDAILVGAGTVIADNPELSVRHYPRRPRDPRRIILDSTLKLPLSAQVLRDRNVLVATTVDADPAKLTALRQSGMPVVVTGERDGRVDVHEVLRWCTQASVTSLLVEGGREVFDSFVRAGLLQRWYLLVAPQPLGRAGVDVLSDLTPLKRWLAATEPEFFGSDAFYECTVP